MSPEEILKRRIIIDRTPTVVSPHVRSFCRNINPGVEPLFLDIRADATAVYRECFDNVLARCKRDGGEIQYGWAIWTWPHIWIKAEHHAVWRNLDGDLIEITPNTPDVTDILFLPDSTHIHDPTRATRIQNIVHPLKADPDILDVPKAEAAIRAYEDQNTEPGTSVVKANAYIYEQLQLSKEAALFRVILRYHRASKPCMCSSGRKFRDCHFQYLALFLDRWEAEQRSLADARS